MPGEEFKCFGCDKKLMVEDVVWHLVVDPDLLNGSEQAFCAMGCYDAEEEEEFWNDVPTLPEQKKNALADSTAFSFLMSNDVMSADAFTSYVFTNSCPCLFLVPHFQGCSFCSNR